MARFYTTDLNTAINSDDIFAFASPDSAASTETEWTLDGLPYVGGINTRVVRFSRPDASEYTYSGAITEIEIIAGAGLGSVLKFTPGFKVEWADAYGRQGLEYHLVNNWGTFTSKFLSGADRMTGSNMGDTLSSYAGADRLNGGMGDDTMLGGKGSDRYTVADSGDTVVELARGGKADAIRALIDFSLADNVENLRLVGTATTATGNELANNIRGNELANTLFGMSGNDRMLGGAGADQIFCGPGSDSVLGGGAADMFGFRAPDEIGHDRIFDFGRGADTIGLDGDAFGLGADGMLDETLFAANRDGLARDSGDRVIYNTRNGELSYDADGDGDGGAVLLARLHHAPRLSHSDIFVI